MRWSTFWYMTLLLLVFMWNFLHQANTPVGPPEDFQRSHHPYVAEAEESKLMPWRITDRMWRVFSRRTFINSSWQLNGNWFCKNEKRSFKTIIHQGGLVSTMPEVSLWSLTALTFFSSSLGKMTSTFILAKQHDFRQSWTEFFFFFFLRSGFVTNCGILNVTTKDGVQWGLYRYLLYTIAWMFQNWDWRLLFLQLNLSWDKKERHIIAEKIWQFIYSAALESL